MPAITINGPIGSGAVTIGQLVADRLKINFVDRQAVGRQEGNHSDLPRPNLILLDLRMPKKDGFEVLKEISEDSELKRIPTILLTGTNAEHSFLSQYNVPPSRYWRKPITLERFNLAIRRLDSIGWRIGTGSFV